VVGREAGKLGAVFTLVDLDFTFEESSTWNCAKETEAGWGSLPFKYTKF
jgi:hypothetical protein